MNYKKIDEFTAVVTGGTPSTEKQEYWEGGDIPWLQSGCCQNCDVESAEKYITQEGYNNSSAKMMPADTVMIALTGATAGKVGYLRFQACGNQSITGILPCDSMDQRFIFYYLLSQRDKILADCIGGAQPHISQGYVKNILVPVPSIDEQKIIVKHLSIVSSIIKKKKQEIAMFDDLIKARFVEMFGDPETNPKDWEKRPLADVITAANNGMARRGNDEDGNIVMRLVELQDGYIDYSKPNRIILTEAEKKRYLLKDKDFLFARVNGNPENVGRCAVFYDIGEPVFHNDHIIRVHFDDEDLDGPFASALLNSEYGKRQLRNQIKTSAGQYTVSQDGIGAIVAILPPIEIQRQFAAFVGQVDKSKVAVQKALDEAQLLFDSLMQEYFG